MTVATTPPAPDHLVPAAREALALSDAERVRLALAERWVHHPAARAILDRLEDLYAYPAQTRMPNLLVVGESNSGKSALLRRFAERHPPDANPEGDAARIPVFTVEAPTGPDEGRLYHAVLDRLLAPYGRRDPLDRKQYQVTSLLRRVGTRVLVIDELHNALSGTLARRGQFLNAIKYLANTLRIPIVLAGTRDAFNVLQPDAQMQNRFPPMQLRRFDGGDDWRRLVRAFEQTYPLRAPSGLWDRGRAAELLKLTEGVVGELAALLNEAAARAIRTGTERIDDAVLKATVDALDWRAPSARKWRDAPR